MWEPHSESSARSGKTQSRLQLGGISGEGRSEVAGDPGDLASLEAELWSRAGGPQPEAPPSRVPPPSGGSPAAHGFSACAGSLEVPSASSGRQKGGAKGTFSAVSLPPLGVSQAQEPGRAVLVLPLTLVRWAPCAL